MGNCPPPTRQQLQAQPRNGVGQGAASRRAGQHRRNVRILSRNAGWSNRCQSAPGWSSLEILTLQWLPLWYGSSCVTSASPAPKPGARCLEPTYRAGGARPTTDAVKGRSSSTAKSEGSDTIAERQTDPALWYASTSHLGTAAKRTRLLCHGWTQ